MMHLMWKCTSLYAKVTFLDSSSSKTETEHRNVFEAWFLTLLNQAIGNIQETFNVKMPCKILCRFICEGALKVCFSCIGSKVCDILGSPQTVNHFYMPPNHLEPEVYIFNRLGAEERRRSLQCVRDK